MFRLGLRLTLKSGKEALVRLFLTTLAVAIGVALLLGVLAEFNAFQRTSDRPSRESTQSIQENVSSNDNVDLWNYSENIYKGQFIEQLDIAPLGPNAPVPPGVSSLPKSGQYYASPALENLITTVPRDELGNRFPGTYAGAIGQTALAGPNSLTIYVGYSSDQLMKLPGTVEVNTINTSPETEGTTNLYKIAFVVVAILLLFPLLILVNTATRLAAARREERYAALRLVGATPSQVNIIASVDAFIGALFGAVLGIGLFLIIKTWLDSLSLSGASFFADYVTPTAWGYLLIIIGVPIAATIASLLSLRRVQISPLGVSRKVTPPRPKIWRWLPLIIGLLLLVLIVGNGGKTGPGPIAIVIILVLFGLVSVGPWLVKRVAKILEKLGGGPSSLLASRRLSDNPKVAFRSVSGLVLAMFVGSMVAVLVPTVSAAQSPKSSASLTNVLRMSFGFAAQTAGAPSEVGGSIHIKAGSPTGPPPVIGLSPQAGSELIKKIESFSGTSVVPMYDNSSYSNVFDCASLKKLPILGTCPPGLKYDGIGGSNSSTLLFTDNPIFVNRALPVINPNSQGTSSNLTDLYLQAVFIKTNNSNTLERVRTFLTNYDLTLQLGANGAGLTGWQMGDLEPETFGEVAQIRNNDDTNIEHVIFAVTAITILIAGCSLAVNTGGSIVERKRPFTLLRLSGTSTSTLIGVVMLEAALPLLVASLFAAIIGFIVVIPILAAIKPPDINIQPPEVAYYLTVLAGLIVSLLIISATLPLLKRVTNPDSARFE